MKKNLLLITSLLIISVSLMGQITIGTQVAQSGTNGISPYNYYWESRRVQFVYTASEITTAGGAAGFISAIAWDVSQVTANNLLNYEVRLAHTTATNAATHNTATLTTVVNAHTLTPGSIGWRTIPFDNSFYWDGINNLLVDVCWGVNSGYSSTGQVWMYNNVANQTRGTVSETQNMCAENTATVRNYKPRVQLTFGSAGVMNPTAFTATGVSNNQINLSWAMNTYNDPVMLVWNTQNTFGTPVSGTTYSVGNTIPGGGIVLQNNTNTTFNHTGLNPNTIYYYKAFSVDATNAYSAGVSANDTTFCVAVSAPLTEGFDNTPSGTVPVCWSKETNVIAWRATSGIFPQAGTQCMVTYFHATNAKNDWFFTPGIDMTQGTSYTIQFYLRAPGYLGNGESLGLKWGTAPNAASMNTTPIWQNTNIQLPNWTLVSTTFTPSTSGTHYFGWHANSIADLDYIAVDEILIMESPSIDLSFADFYQNSALPTPKSNLIPFAPAIPNSQIKWSNVSTFVHGSNGAASSNDNHSVMFSNPAKVAITIPASIQVVAELENIGSTAASYNIDWEVGGITQPTYNGPTVNVGASDVANLTYTPTARGSFTVTGDLVVLGDQLLLNNANSFKMRVYPTVFARTIYDRQVNTVDTYVGYNNTAVKVKTAVRYTAAGYERPIGLDVIYRTETATTGTFTVQLCAAGATTQAPGTPLFTATYNDPVYFAPEGDYLHFAFDENLQTQTFAPGSDYWIIIEYPLGILYPGAAHSASITPGITPGRSFVSNSSVTTWNPLIITSVEYAWIMRAVHVEDIPACPMPSALNATNIDSESADISWTAGGIETNWEYIFGLAPLAYPVGSGTATQNTTITLSGLDEETQFQFYVRADCGSDVSDWAGPFTFTTTCTNCLQQTYSAGDIPSDFQDPWVGPSTCPGSMSFTIPTGYQVSGVSVSYSMLAQNGAWMSEQYSKLYSPTLFIGEPVYYVGVGDALGTMNYNRTNINNFNGATGNFVLELHAGRIWDNVAPNNGCNTYYQRVNNNSWTVKVYYDLIPTCPPPTGLTATNFTPYTANLSWTSSVGLYDVEAGLPGFTPGTNNAVSWNYGNTGEMYQAWGLTPATNYEFYVRSDCGSGDLSTWAGPYSFSTTCLPNTLPFSEDFENISTCWWVLDIDGGGEGWSLYTGINHTPGGEVSALHLYGNPGYNEQGALITPEIILPSGGTFKLSFWSYNIDSIYYGQNAVLISNDGFVTNSELLWAPDTVSEATWELVEIDIPSTYAGSIVSIAFLYEGDFAHAWFIDDVEVFEDIPPTKTLEVEVLLEGLYMAAGLMNEAQGDGVAEYGSGIADVVIIYLYDAVDPDILVYNRVAYLNTNGIVQVTDIPGSLNEEYYIVIKNRNHLETWSADPVSFAGTTPVSYNFSNSITQAYESNMKPTGDGYFVVFSGDINQDEIVDGGDMLLVENASNQFLMGYYPEDINGDGIVDGVDMSFLENNANVFVQVKKP